VPEALPHSDEPIRPAATVMLVRDGDAGIEVFTLQRTHGAVFGGGAHVFPGGRVDAVDEAAELEAICDGLSDAAASARLGIAAGGLAFWVAAIRECFEEAGVLLARPRGRPDAIRFDDEHVVARFEAARRAVYAGTLGLVELCRDEGLRLMAGEMRYVAHWVTPLGEPRRFDTRFFLAAAPAAQTPLHDDDETVASAWMRPDEALERFAARELRLMPPTVASMRFLREFDTAAAAMAAAAVMERPQVVLPRLRFAGGAPVAIVLPGEPGYDELI
jgi:8-oxo-dGTP pyrophosphatase MutT (NUDIX family)